MHNIPNIVNIFFLLNSGTSWKETWLIRISMTMWSKKWSQFNKSYFPEFHTRLIFKSFWYMLSLLPERPFPAVLSWKTLSSCLSKLGAAWDDACKAQKHSIWHALIYFFTRYCLRAYSVPRSCSRLCVFSSEQNRQECNLCGVYILSREGGPL